MEIIEAFLVNTARDGDHDRADYQTKSSRDTIKPIRQLFGHHSS